MFPPLVGNGFRTNLALRFQLALAKCSRKGLSGVDFDFEYIPEKNRGQYVDLVREARAVLGPQGYTVTVALAPKTSADQEGVLYQGHDYAGMGAVADLSTS